MTASHLAAGRVGATVFLAVLAAQDGDRRHRRRLRPDLHHGRGCVLDSLYAGRAAPALSTKSISLLLLGSWIGRGRGLSRGGVPRATPTLCAPCRPPARACGVGRPP